MRIALLLLLISFALKGQREIPGIPIKQILDSQKKAIKSSKKNNSKKIIKKDLKIRPKKEVTNGTGKSKTN